MAKTASTAEVRTYELTYLVPTSFTDSEVSKIAEEITKSVTKHHGTIVKQDNWGKKKMAYRIKHGNTYHAEAHYTHIVFSAPADQVQSFEKVVFLQPNIVRHLLVVSEPVKTVPTKKVTESKVE